MIQLVLQRIFGTQNERALKKLWPRVNEIDSLENLLFKYLSI